MTRYNVPGVGLVVVALTEHRFGMTGETLMLLESVQRANGVPVSAEEHERTAQYLHALGVI
ncbi:hypothetical protein [Microbacterium sp. T32]|uniref:hypothetical protein n=1 Tax=Microbacterium sp. T32 TaxID=1776083 RepID=UPI0007ABBEAA|nr:hypothetical protein [Microbacterium sp. T32]KZE43298.1 hypothetical protein AVW09_00725 [Microbacterium sp. T32]